jgi:hypothetical protein
VLVIRRQQIDAIRAEYTRAFERFAIDHLQLYFPQQCAAVGGGLLAQVRAGMRRASEYKLEAQSDVLRFLNLWVFLEPDFDRNAKFPWAQEVLSDATLAPDIKMEMVSALAMERLDPASAAPLEEDALPDTAASEAEEDGFDGIIIEDPEPPADPELPEPYDGELPPDPDDESLPLPTLPDFLRCDLHHPS